MFYNQYHQQINFYLGWQLLLKFGLKSWSYSLHAHDYSWHFIPPSCVPPLDLPLSLVSQYLPERAGCPCVRQFQNVVPGNILEWGLDLQVEHYTRQQDMCTHV